MTILEGVSALPRIKGTVPIAVLASCDIALVLGSVIVSLASNDWSWFQRSGSLLVLLSALDQSRDVRWQRWRTTLAILGTLIWGYGDLLSGV